MPWTGGYEDVRTYLRWFANVGDDPVPYDFNGVVRLSQHASEAGLEEVGGSFRNGRARSS